MNDISVRRAMTVPVLLALAMLGAAGSIAAMTGVDGTDVFGPYILAWGSVTILSILFWVFIEVTRMARTHADEPLETLFARIKTEQSLFALSALVFPIFIGAYTWAKCSIPFAVGYPWERFWAGADRAILGADAWTLAHAALGESIGPEWTFFYAVVWGFALVISGSLISAFAGRRFSATFFTAMMLAWFFGGFILAYALSAAGPVFAHLADPAMADRFTSLRVQLLASLGRDDIVVQSQRYLAAGYGKRAALKGGGISAMPSMHIATATIFVLAAWRTPWVFLAAAFWLLTFVGSVYLGYHYAIDAPVAALVAVPCWMVAGRIYRPSAGT